MLFTNLQCGNVRRQYLSYMSSHSLLGHHLLYDSTTSKFSGNYILLMCLLNNRNPHTFKGQNYDLKSLYILKILNILSYLNLRKIRSLNENINKRYLKVFLFSLIIKFSQQAMQEIKITFALNVILLSYFQAKRQNENRTLNPISIFQLNDALKRPLLFLNIVVK